MARLARAKQAADADEYAARRGELTREWVRSSLLRCAPCLKEAEWEIEGEVVTMCTLPIVSIPELPHEYACKGGAARLALTRALGLDERPVRDIDLARQGRARRSLDDELARRYAPEDFINGRGVELFSSLESYLRSRDLSINEVLYRNGTISASIQCVLDSSAEILRPSRYRSGSLHSPKRLLGNTYAKMLRFKAQDDRWELRGLPPGAGADPFALALHLRRALEERVDIAKRFLDLCYHQLVFSPTPQSGDTVVDAIVALAPNLAEGVEFFNGALSGELMRVAREILENE